MGLGRPGCGQGQGFSFKVKILTFVKTRLPAGSTRVRSPLSPLGPWLLVPPNPPLPPFPLGAGPASFPCGGVSGSWLAGRAFSLPPLFPPHTHALELVSAVKFDLSIVYQLCTSQRSIDLSHVNHLCLACLFSHSRFGLHSLAVLAWLQACSLS